MDDAPTSSSQLTKLGVCEVCGTNSAKYTCPRCEVKTCDLKCTNIHKKELNCDGNRDKTKFVPLKNFTNLELSSDYRLLEEITRNVECLKKNSNTMFTRNTQGLPHHLYLLQKAANDRKTILKFLPKNFDRHKENTTHIKNKQNTIYWHIDWIFFNADSLKLSDTNIPETSRLTYLLNKYLAKQDDAIIQEKLQFYQAAGIQNIKILLKAERKAGCKFYELDPLQTIKDNLKNKIIIEYPIIHLVLNEHKHLYNVIDSDDDNEESDDVKQVNGNVVVNRIVKNSEREDSIDNSFKNLLFNNEQTESDMSD